MDILKSGTKVTIKHTVLEGSITKVALAEDGSHVLYTVSYPDNDGVQQERVFTDSQVVAA